MSGFSLQRVAIIAAIILPLELLYRFITDTPVTAASMIKVVLLILAVDIALTLLGKKKK